MKRLALPFLCLVVIAAGCKAPKPNPPAAPGTATGATASEPVVACGAGEISDGLTSVPPPSGETPADGDRLVRVLEAEPATLNTLISNDGSEQEINFFIMEGLLDLDLMTGELKPMLAESWEVSPDNLTFTFHLRRGVKFHNGQPFTADDFIFSMDRIMDPKVDAASLRSYFVKMDSYKKVDDFTVVVKWKEPYFKALEMVGGVAALPSKSFPRGENFNQSAIGRHPIGTGPFRFAEWTTGQQIVIEKNPDYWGQKPHLNAIVFKIITNEDVSLQVLKKGELDFQPRLSRTQWFMQTGSAEFKEKFYRIHYPYPSYSYIGWNMRNPLFQDRRVRQALTMLMNREAMLSQIFHCLGVVATGPFYYRTPSSDPTIKPWPYDPARAQALLAEAGWKDENQDGVLEKDGVPFRFEMSFTADVPEWEAMAVIYQQDLKKVGIDMVIRKLEWAVFMENVQRWKFDACAMAWALDAHSDLYPLFHSSQADIVASQNHVGYKNPEVDRLIELNRAEFNAQKREEYGRQLHRLIHEDQPYTFFISGERLAALATRFHDIRPQPLRPCFDFKEWYVPAPLQKYQGLPVP
jgi:peptide/nickel transport system substrate-binding protein